jgi:hypothetical protein
VPLRCATTSGATRSSYRFRVNRVGHYRVAANSENKWITRRAALGVELNRHMLDFQ